MLSSCQPGRDQRQIERPTLGNGRSGHDRAPLLEPRQHPDPVGAEYVLSGICDLWHINTMLTTFEVLAQPIRRSILDHLRDGERLVGDLAAGLGLNQPLTSKHLRVLRDAGLVTVRIDGPRRWYALRVDPLAELDSWLAPYRWMWESHLDSLGAHLDTMTSHAAADHQGDTDAR